VAFIIPAGDANGQDMNKTLETIYNRRSVRAFDRQPLKQQTIDQIIDAAIRSPTAGNMMLYSILQITDPELKKKLVTTCDHQPFIAKAPLVLLFLADYQRWFDYFLASDVQPFCDRHKRVMRSPAEGDLMLACCDALIAAQTSVIAAEALGVGSCYIGDIMENFEQHQEMFCLPKYTFPVTMLCYGYPTEHAASRKLTSRISRKYIVQQNRYIRQDRSTLNRIFADKRPETFTGDAVNTGQHYYLKKFAADYSIEMTRSVRQMIQSWCENPEELNEPAGPVVEPRRS